MGGGKSSSSTDAGQTTNTLDDSAGVILGPRTKLGDGNTFSTGTGTATGTVGDVFQGQTITINDAFSDNVSDAFNELIDLSRRVIDVAAGAGQAALVTVAAAAQTASQPDLTTLQSGQDTIKTVALAGIAGIVLYFIMRK